MKYFHGSFNHLDVGFVLKGRGKEYETFWSKTPFFDVLERERPEGCIPHSNAVFAVSDAEDIDYAGGGTDWVFELKPKGQVDRHDVAWSTEISELLSDGYGPGSQKVMSAAKNYWDGVQYPKVIDSVWEYLMEEAEIIHVEPYVVFAPDPEMEKAARQILNAV